MKYVLALLLVSPMAVAAAVGPDPWYKLSFVGAALSMILIILGSDELERVEEPDERVTYLSTEEVLALTAERKAAGL